MRNIIIIAAALFIAGCASMKPQSFPMRPVGSLTQVSGEIEQFNRSFQGTSCYTGTLNILWYSVPMMLIVRTEGNTLIAYATTVNGMSFYNVRYTRGESAKVTVSDIIPAQAKRLIFNTFHKDLERIFMMDSLTPVNTITPIRLYDENTVVQYSASPLHITSKKCGSFPHRKWEVSYYNWFADVNAFGAIKYKNYDRHFTLNLSNCNQ